MTWDVRSLVSHGLPFQTRVGVVRAGSAADRGDASDRPEPLGMATSTVVLEQPTEPLLVEIPPGRHDLHQCAGLPWLVMVHALGENRTGTNYWQAQAARIIASADIVVARFDLSGYGESLADKDVQTWRRQCADAVTIARQHRASSVHMTARGLHAALLADQDLDGMRIAVFPPRTDQLTWWERLEDRPDTDVVRVDGSPAGEERVFWEACGAETSLLAGFRIPIGVLRTLVTPFLDTDVERPWTVAVASSPAPPGTLVCSGGPLTRLESERAGLSYLLRQYLAGVTAERVDIRGSRHPGQG